MEATGCIAHKHRDGSITELMRFHFSEELWRWERRQVLWIGDCPDSLGL